MSVQGDDEYCSSSPTVHSFLALCKPITTLKHVLCDVYICIIGFSCTAYSQILQEGRVIPVLAVDGIQKIEKMFFSDLTMCKARNSCPRYLFHFFKINLMSMRLRFSQIIFYIA